jgi:hypothetical protein
MVKCISIEEGYSSLECWRLEAPEKKYPDVFTASSAPKESIISIFKFRFTSQTPEKRGA